MANLDIIMDERFANILGKKVRILLSDERVIEGDLQCMDKDLNFILGNAIEHHGMNASDHQVIEVDPAKVPRLIGMTMVPGQHVVNIFCLSSNQP